jgi:hypothetical protein
VIPDFDGGSLSSAVDWAEASGLSWEAIGLPPLRASWRMRLFDNYIVTSQEPAAGSTATAGSSLKLRAKEA